MIDPKYFDEEFYKGKTKEKGGERDLLYTSNREYGLRLGRVFRDEVPYPSDWTILDIGGGTGWDCIWVFEVTR